MSMPSGQASPATETMAAIPEREVAAQLAALRELTPQQFQLWRHHPVSQAVLRFLADWARELRRDVLERWESGTGLADEHEARGRVLMLREVGELDIGVMREFYAEALGDVVWPESRN